MAIISARDFSLELCEVLGLDPKKTKSIHIGVEPNDAIIVSVRTYLLNHEADKIKVILKNYELIPKRRKKK